MNALEPAELDNVRFQLQSDAAASRNLARIQAILKPLESDREEPLPPPDLVSKTLAKLDATLAIPKPRLMLMSRWIEVAVAASIGLVGFGLVATGMNKAHVEYQKAVCADNLRRISGGLNQYADVHENRFPQVGVAHAPKAGDFPALLVNAGTWPDGVEPRCAGSEDVGYSYTLGHRDTAGNLVGLSRNCENPGQMPIVADFPSHLVNADGSVSPHGRGQNVLFINGNVVYSLSPNIGPNGDHIYQNDDGLPRAGLHANDAVLGRPHDRP